MMEIIIKKYMINRVICGVMEENKKTNVLPGLQIDNSPDKGFTLPMTREWLDATFEGCEIARKYHRDRCVEFQYDGDENICSLDFKDGCEYWSDDECRILHEMILNVLQNMKAKTFYVDCEDILQKYNVDPDELFDKSLTRDVMDAFVTDIKNRMDDKPEYGDVVQLLPDNQRYRNSGTLIMTTKLEVLPDNYDEYGNIPNCLRVSDGGFNPIFWFDAVCHNSYIFLDRFLIESVILNWNNHQKRSQIKINEKQFFVVVHEDEILVNIDDDIKELMLDCNSVFEIYEDVEPCDVGLYILFRC